MQQCTLVLLVNDKRILLAMKKRGFGAGRWNGMGGKANEGESVEQAMIRECQEEIGVTPVVFEKVAVQDFVFSENKSVQNQQMHTFVCSEWQGEPAESEEMAPLWFAISEIPYNDMWQDDIHWLPEVLAGKKLHCRFTFDDKDNLLEAKLHEAILADLR